MRKASSVALVPAAARPAQVAAPCRNYPRKTPSSPPQRHAGRRTGTSGMQSPVVGEHRISPTSCEAFRVQRLAHAKEKRPGSSFEFPGHRVFRVLNYATNRFADCRKARRGRSSVVLVRHKIESIFRSVCPNLDNVSLLSVAQ